MVELKLNTYQKISMSEKTFILVISGVFMMAWFETRTDELCLLVLHKKTWGYGLSFMNLYCKFDSYKDNVCLIEKSVVLTDNLFFDFYRI